MISLAVDSAAGVIPEGACHQPFGVGHVSRPHHSVSESRVAQGKHFHVTPLPIACLQLHSMGSWE